MRFVKAAALAAADLLTLSPAASANTRNTDTGTFHLDISKVVGCFGEFLDGDKLDLDADYALTTTDGNLTFQ